MAKRKPKTVVLYKQVPAFYAAKLDYDASLKVLCDSAYALHHVLTAALRDGHITPKAAKYLQKRADDLHAALYTH